jgi:hypothetical protein
MVGSSRGWTSSARVAALRSWASPIMSANSGGASVTVASAVASSFCGASKPIRRAMRSAAADDVLEDVDGDLEPLGLAPGTSGGSSNALATLTVSRIRPAVVWS